MSTPDWANLAAVPLPEEEQAHEAYEASGDALAGAVMRTVQALEHHDFPELAEKLSKSFTRAFSQETRND